MQNHQQRIHPQIPWILNPNITKKYAANTLINGETKLHPDQDQEKSNKSS